MGGCRLCIQLIREFALYIISPSSLKKREKNVGKSEKSPENFSRKVFQNAYISHTNYIGRGLEVDHLLDTMQLHSAGSAVLADVRKFLQSFFKSISGLRFTTKRLAK